MNNFIDPRLAQRNGGTPYFQHLPFGGPQPAPQNPLQVGPPPPATPLQAQPLPPMPGGPGALAGAVGPMAGQVVSNPAKIRDGVPSARAPIPGTGPRPLNLQAPGSAGGGGPMRPNPGPGGPARNFRATGQMGKAGGSREKLLRALMSKRGG